MLSFVLLVGMKVVARMCDLNLVRASRPGHSKGGDVASETN